MDQQSPGAQPPPSNPYRAASALTAGLIRILSLPVQNYSSQRATSCCPTTASLLCRMTRKPLHQTSLINKTQHSQDKFLKLQSRQAASQTVGRVPFLCPSITNQPHMANSISEVPGNYSLLSSLAGRLPAQGQIRLPAASSPRRLFPSLLRDSRLLHTRSDTPGVTHSAH